MKVLFTGCTFSDEELKNLKEKNIIVENGNVDYTEEYLTEKLKEFDCYINGGDEICTEKVLENNQHLKLVSFLGTGYQKYIDVNKATEFNIPVSYTPYANAKSVAEYTVALILDCVKKITFSNNQVKNGVWEKYKTFNLEGKTLGIVGMGHIGSHISKILCDGFGMKLIYNSTNSKQYIDEKYNTNLVSLEEVFEKSDIISINATCTEKNKGMINKKHFDLAKENLVIVNTARAELIERKDLEDAMQNNKVNCFGFDGYFDEPINSDDKILNISDEKFIITPHNAYNSKDALNEMNKLLIESLEDVLEGKNIRNLVIINY